MKPKYLVLHPNDLNLIKKKDKIVLFHNYIILKKKIQGSDVFNIKISEKELFKQFKVLFYLYDKILNNIYKNLNKINKTNKSKRFWSLVVGPWLINYLQIMIRRWTEIEKISKIKNKKFLNYYYQKKHIYPEDFIHFMKLSQFPEFSCNLYSDLIGNYFKKKNFNFIKRIRSEIKNSMSFKFAKSVNKKYHFFNFKEILLKAFNLFSSKKKKIVLINTRIGILKEIFIYFKTFNFPYFFTNSKYTKDKNFYNTVNVNIYERKKIINNLNSENKFEDFVFKNIINFLPKSYLENFEKYLFLSKKNFPKKVKLIFSAVDHYTYDELKIWVGNQIDKHSKLISLQHGANPGYSIFTANEYLDIKNANICLTWGWKEKKTNTQKSFFSLKKPIRKKIANNLLLVMTSNILIQNNIKSNLNYIDNLDNHKFNVTLIKELIEKFSNELLVRLPKIGILADYYRRELTQINKKIRFDNNANILKSLQSARAVITSWDGTVFLQSLNANIPTIAYWDERNNIIRKHVIEYFKDLRRNSVLHNNEKNIKKTLLKNFNNIEDWWTESSRASSVKNFTNMFCRNGKIEEKLINCCN